MKFIDTNIHNTIDEVVPILSRSIDKNITIKKSLRAIFPRVKADPVQLQNGLLNIAINERDAIPGGGELAFTTDNVVIDDEDYRAKQNDPVTGPCIRIKITDKGVGISPENISRIFEPFFTPK